MEESQASTLAAGERRRVHRALRVLVADDDGDTVDPLVAAQILRLLEPLRQR